MLWSDLGTKNTWLGSGKKSCLGCFGRYKVSWRSGPGPKASLIKFLKTLEVGKEATQ